MKAAESYLYISNWLIIPYLSLWGYSPRISYSCGIFHGVLSWGVASIFYMQMCNSSCKWKKQPTDEDFWAIYCSKFPWTNCKYALFFFLVFFLIIEHILFHKLLFFVAEYYECFLWEYLLIGSYQKFKWENTHTLTHTEVMLWQTC